MTRLTAFLLFFLVLTVTSDAQVKDSLQTTSAKQRFESYMKKRKTYKTIGFTLLGSGVLMCGISYATYAGNGFNGHWGGEEVFTAGLVAAGASIPFFIAAGVAKSKALLAIKNEPLSFATGVNSNERQVLLAIAIHL